MRDIIIDADWGRQLATLIPKYRQQPLRNAEEEFSSQAVISSSTELFHFYRLALAQCAKLSTGSNLLEMSTTFAKYLDQYGQQVLYYFLSEKPGAQGPSVEDAVLILNTADYCYLTCNQLEEKIKSRIDEDLRAKVDLQNQADAFMGIASATVRVLVRRVEIACEPSWREMRNTPWSKLESVGDQSTYVAELLRHVKDNSAEILKCLHKQQYARAYCDNLVDQMANTYIANIVLSKPISEVGAEQMLLDSYVLKKGFTEIPTLNDEPGTAPPARYVSLPSITSDMEALQSMQLRQTGKPEHVQNRSPPQNPPSPTVPAGSSRASLPHPHCRQIRHQLPQNPRPQRHPQGRSSPAARSLRRLPRLACPRKPRAELAAAYAPADTIRTHRHRYR